MKRVLPRNTGVTDSDAALNDGLSTDVYEEVDKQTREKSELLSGLGKTDDKTEVRKFWFTKGEDVT